MRHRCSLSFVARYRYEICPFDKVTQSGAGGGGSQTVMGNWHADKGWSSATEMLYDGGQGCWQGPQRSCRVEVLCGAENVVSDTQEPNKCEYTMKLATPAACSPAELQKLQAEFESEHTLGTVHSEL